MAGPSPGKTVKHRIDPEDLKIGQKIRAKRMARGVSQTTLAGGLEVTFQQVQKYERGANRVSASRLQRIADILDTPITFFYRGSGSRTTKQYEDEGLALVQSRGGHAAPARLCRDFLWSKEA